MTTPIVGTVQSNTTTQNSSTTAFNTTLGKDDFLKILVTQLQNQDPTHPLEDKAFIAQMAQFTSVEQLTNMSEQMSKLRQSLGISSSIIGKDIQWNSVDSTGAPAILEGTVSAISFKDGQQFAMVNNQQVPLDQILKIKNSGVQP